MGQLLIHLADPMTLHPFYLIALLSLLAILPLMSKTIQDPKLTPTPRLETTTLFKISPLGFIGVFISGIILAATHGLVPIFGKGIGLTAPEIGNLMALLIFGGLSFQWPTARLADRGCRHQILLLVCFLTAALGLAIALIDQTPSYLLFTLIFLFGGASFTIYPLSMAHACEKLENHQIVSATGSLVLSYGIGSIAGPLIAPFSMQWGASGLFYFLAFVATILILVGCKKQKA
jgi:MFS family permease